ncbi:MAG: hypothetical protein B9S26_15195 [Opitutia bacterium Tous-C4FEB]|nr:MAG: hypothetical protein B9S26_15195 [Opitutae bacterium Tous-C4FEB]
MSTELQSQIREYIATTKWATLAYVRDDGAPMLRVMGSFALAPTSFDLYFSSDKAAAKVAQIERHPKVSFYFQHEGHTFADYRNVSIVGEAHRVSSGPDRDEAISLLRGKSPHFKELAETNQLHTTAIFKIATAEINGLDYTRPVGPDRVISLVCGAA